MSSALFADVIDSISFCINFHVYVKCDDSAMWKSFLGIGHLKTPKEMLVNLESHFSSLGLNFESHLVHWVEVDAKKWQKHL